MSTTPTIDPLVPPEPAQTPPANPAVPALDEIESLAPEERMVYRGGDREFYEKLLEIVDEDPGIRIAYDGKNLEIMTVSRVHEEDTWFAASVVEAVAKELGLRWWPLRSTAWKRVAIKRGIEADGSYDFAEEKVAVAVAGRGRKSRSIDEYPNPDPVMAIDIPPPRIDRMGIYAALKLPEVWRFPSGTVTIERLTEEGTYADQEASGFRSIRADEVARWVFHEDVSDLSAWERRLRDWVQAELLPRRAR